MAKMLTLVKKVEGAFQDEAWLRVVGHAKAAGKGVEVKFDPALERAVLEFKDENGTVQTTTVGRYLIRNGGDMLSHTWVNQFSARVDALLRYAEVKDRFKLVTGAEIANQYRIGGDSGCMNGPHRNILSDFYRINEPRIKMLLLMDKEGTRRIGRALVWETESGETVVDRVYGIGYDWIQPLYELYAAEHDWLLVWGHVIGQYGRHGVQAPPGTKDGRLDGLDYIYFDGKIPGHGALPYLDSFGWGYLLKDRPGYCRMVIKKDGYPPEWNVGTNRLGWQFMRSELGGPWSTLKYCGAIKECGYGRCNALMDPEEEGCRVCENVTPKERDFNPAVVPEPITQFVECAGCGYEHEYDPDFGVDGGRFCEDDDVWYCDACYGAHLCGGCDDVYEDLYHVHVVDDVEVTVCDGCQDNLNRVLLGVARDFGYA